MHEATSQRVERAEMWLRGPISGGRGLLALLCIGAPVVESLILQLLGFVSALPLSVQLSAPEPFAIFHDLRWVFTYAWSGPSALWQLIALLGCRSLFDALVVGAAWPEEGARPRFRSLWSRSFLYTAIAIVVMSPWATFTFAAGVASLGWFLLGAMLASVLTALAMPPALITGSWRRMAPWRTLAYMAAAWLALMVAALAMTFSPPWMTLVVAAVGGMFNALFWRRIVRSVLAATPARSRVPAAPLALALVMVVFIAGGGLLYGRVRTSMRRSDVHAPALPVPTAAALGGRQAVVFVFGFGSTYDGGAHQLLGPSLLTWYFSYAGLDADGRPRAYGPDETYQSLERSARLLAAEVDELHALTDRPVAVISESEGTMVTGTYFATEPHPPVSVYVQSSPLMRPARDSYPRPGREGYGWLGGWEARGMFAIVRRETSAFKANPDIPFLRSLLARAPRFRSRTLCAIPGVRSYMFVPLEAAVTMGRGPVARIPWVALPGWHATLLHRGAVQDDVRRLLASGHLPNRPAWRFLFQILRGGAAAWQSPALPLALEPAWDAGPESDPAFGGSSCDAQYSSNMR